MFSGDKIKSRSTSIKLFEQRGETSVFIDAYFCENGDFVIAGQDIGGALAEIFGDSDHEYWLTIPADQKEKLLKILSELPASQEFIGKDMLGDELLARLVQVNYGGRDSIVMELRQICNENGVKSEFSTY